MRTPTTELSTRSHLHRDTSSFCFLDLLRSKREATAINSIGVCSSLIGNDVDGVDGPTGEAIHRAEDL